MSKLMYTTLIYVIIYVMTSVPVAVLTWIITKNISRAIAKTTKKPVSAYTRICMAAINSAVAIAYVALYITAVIVLQ